MFRRSPFRLSAGPGITVERFVNCFLIYGSEIRLVDAAASVRSIKELAEVPDVTHLLAPGALHGQVMRIPEHWKTVLRLSGGSTRRSCGCVPGRIPAGRTSPSAVPTSSATGDPAVPVK
jgi:hypothetical protein